MTLGGRRWCFILYFKENRIILKKKKKKTQQDSISSEGPAAVQWSFTAGERVCSHRLQVQEDMGLSVAEHQAG